MGRGTFGRAPYRGGLRATERAFRLSRDLTKRQLSFREILFWKILRFNHERLAGAVRQDEAVARDHGP